MIYLFITERGRPERLLGVMPDEHSAREAAERLISRQPGPDRAVIDQAVICQLVDGQLQEQSVFKRQQAGE